MIGDGDIDEGISWDLARTEELEMVAKIMLIAKDKQRRSPFQNLLENLIATSIIY